jgi:hypothetical protein
VPTPFAVEPAQLKTVAFEVPDRIVPSDLKYAIAVSADFAVTDVNINIGALTHDVAQTIGEQTFVLPVMIGEQTIVDAYVQAPQ